MSRTKKFFYNSFSSVVMQVVLLVAGLIVPRLMIITYGSEINGLISSITQFIAYFSLVEAGLAGASIYALYKPLADGDPVGINGVVSGSRKLYMQSGFAFIVLVFVLSVIYPIFIRVSSLSSIEVGLMVLVLGVSGTLNFFTLAKYRVLITADQKLYIINYLQALSVIVNTMIIVFLTNINANILLLRVVALISVLIPPICLHFYVKKNYPFINFNAPPNLTALNKRWDALILQLLGTIQNAAPIILATLFTSLELVSVYSVFSMIVMGVMGIISIFSTGLSASFGELIAREEQGTFRKAFSEYELMSYMIIALIFSCTMVLIMPFIRIYTADVHDINYNVPVIGFLFVINAVLYSIKNPHGTLISSAGLFKETKYQSMIQAGLALGLGAILAKPFGLVGILIGLIFSNIYRDIDLLIYIPKKLSIGSPKISFLRAVRILFQLFMICLPFWFIPMDINGYYDWLLWAVIVAVYSIAIIIFTTYLADRYTLLALIERFRGITGRRLAWSTKR